MTNRYRVTWDVDDDLCFFILDDLYQKTKVIFDSNPISITSEVLLYYWMVDLTNRHNKDYEIYIKTVDEYLK